MAEKVIIEIELRGGEDLKALESAVNKAGGSIKKLEQKSKQASKATKDSFRSSQAAADRLQGGISGITEQIGLMAKAAKKGGKALKASLISTGVGALIVLVGELVANWDEIVSLITSSNDELEKQEKLLDRNLQITDEQLSLLRKESRLAEIRGERLDGFNKKEKTLLRIKKDQIEQQIKILEASLEEEKSLARKATLWEIISSWGRTNGKITDEELEKIQGIEDRISKLKESVVDVDIELEEPEKKRKIKNSVNRREKETGLDSGLKTVDENQAELDKQAEFFREQLGLNKWLNDELSNLELESVENTESANKQRLADRKRTNELIAQNEQELADFKIETAFNVLNALSGLAEEGSAFAKSIAVAQAVLSTYQGINKALAETTDFTPTQTLRFVNAAAVGVAGFANVAKILSTDASGRTKPNIGGGGGFGGAQQAPSFNVVGTSGVNQLAQTLGEQDEPLRAYVVSTEMSTRQALDRNIEQTATIS